MRTVELVPKAAGWDAVLAIARDLSKIAEKGVRTWTGSTDFSLAGGDAGVALFFHVLSTTEHGRTIDTEGARDALLSRAAGALSSEPMTPSLFMGFTGIAWALSAMCDVGGEGADALDGIDVALANHLRAHHEEQLDLVSGVVGIGAYLLERLPRAEARSGLRAIVDQLESTAERSVEGCTWPEPPERLTAEDRAMYPEGRCDLGVAHGIPGIIAFLGRLVRAGVEVERARALLFDSVRWLQAQASGRESPRFAHWSAPVGPLLPTRIAWCYGDIGVSIALLVAATATGSTELRDYAIDLGHRVAERPHDTADIVDVGVCHGTAGAAHQFHRLFRATGDPAFLAASRHWFAETLAARRDGEGVGGYRSVIRDTDLRDVWIDNPELLNGSAGIGLALLAALTDVDPWWDRVLLMSPLGTTAAITEQG
jgi:lantibiotic modifying enzyme